MRYKSLFRVLLKVIAVYLIVTSSVLLLSEGIQAICVLVIADTGGLPSWMQPLSDDGQLLFWLLSVILPNIIQILVGLLLFFRSNWIANLAIPSNRPYCVECGYDLTAHAAEQCPECGTAKPKGDGL